MRKHCPLEPLLGQIQIAKAATYTKRCAKMSTLRNAWFENPEKGKGIFGKVTFYEKLRKKYETKVVGNVSSYCSKFFLF